MIFFISFLILVLQKEHHEQQLQRVRASSAKSQAESVLTVFELREENHRLAKENSKLLGESAYTFIRISAHHYSHYISIGSNILDQAPIIMLYM